MSAPSSPQPNSRYEPARTPNLERVGNMDDLFAKAMLLCQRPSRRNNMLPAYGLKKGERVLLGIDDTYDLRIVDAFKSAVRDIGAVLDIVITDSAGPHRSNYSITKTPIDGADEARAIQTDVRSDLRRFPYLVREIADKHSYEIVINGTAGPIPDVPYRWEKLPWTSIEHWAGEEILFPIDLQIAIDEVVWEQIQKCERVRVTDPEGTDVSFTNYVDGRWLYLSHQWGKPLYITAQEDAEGVIAGTTNHRGVFNWCEATIEAGLVISVKGGGDYGEIWREKLDEFKHVVLPPYQTRKLAGSRQLPGKHRPGFFWYWECAIGSMPKVFRPSLDLYDLLYERRRSGLVHHGFGPNYDEISAMDKLGLPSRHLHIHNLFSTYTGTNARGETTTVIDRGRLTAFDDPRVRKVAERFGDPDALLREAWIPGIPGINTDGDYMRDYGSNARQRVLAETAARAETLKR